MSGISFLRQNANWLVAGILMTLASSFGQTYFISIFAEKVRDEFNLSHGEWGGTYTLGTGISAILMIWAGVLADKYRARVIVSAAFLGLALSCIAMAVNSLAWLLPMVILALRFNGQGMLSHIPGVAMTRWFAAARGKALAISGLGFSIGQAFFPDDLCCSHGFRRVALFVGGCSCNRCCNCTRTFVFTSSRKNPSIFFKRKVFNWHVREKLDTKGSIV